MSRGHNSVNSCFDEFAPTFALTAVRFLGSLGFCNRRSHSQCWPAMDFAGRRCPLPAYFLRSARRSRVRSDFLGVLTAFRWVIELPEQLGHSVGNRFVYDLAKVCL